MATIIGYNKELNKKCTCHKCTAIIEYAPNEEIFLVNSGSNSIATDEGRRIKGINCPSCGTFLRTNH